MILLGMTYCRYIYLYFLNIYLYVYMRSLAGAWYVLFKIYQSMYDLSYGDAESNQGGVFVIYMHSLFTENFSVYDINATCIHLCKLLVPFRNSVILDIRKPKNVSFWDGMYTVSCLSYFWHETALLCWLGCYFWKIYAYRS